MDIIINIYTSVSKVLGPPPAVSVAMTETGGVATWTSLNVSTAGRVMKTKARPRRRATSRSCCRTVTRRVKTSTTPLRLGTLLLACLRNRTWEAGISEAGTEARSTISKVSKCQVTKRGCCLWRGNTVCSPVVSCEMRDSCCPFLFLSLQRSLTELSLFTPFQNQS